MTFHRIKTGNKGIKKDLKGKKTQGQGIQRGRRVSDKLIVTLLQQSKFLVLAIFLLNIKIFKNWADMVVHIYTPSTQEAEQEDS